MTHILDRIRVFFYFIIELSEYGMRGRDMEDGTLR